MMLKGYKVAVFLGLLCLSAITCSATDVSVDCMMEYEAGGAPAVFKSPDCPQWVLPNKSSSLNHLDKCQFATLKGRRPYQEDRMACNPAMTVPMLGKEGQKDVKVSVAAIFDGHGGKEVSNLLSKKFLDYFFLHVVFINYQQAFQTKENSAAISPESSDSVAASDDNSLYTILEEALVRTFKDIDTEFFEKVKKESLHSKGHSAGSTATVALLVNGKLLVGYVGDSKAVLCSGGTQDAQGNLVAKRAEELTRDHHPDRKDEHARIRAAGGSVHVIMGVPRVDGILAMSRAIGDVYLKSSGVIAEPEIIGWRNLTSYNSYLVVASDGIFERIFSDGAFVEGMTPSDVCDIILHETCTLDSSTETVSGRLSTSSAAASSSSLSPAKSIVNAAYEGGSHDNLSVIVIPLDSPYSSSR